MKQYPGCRSPTFASEHSFFHLTTRRHTTITVSELVRDLQRVDNVTIDQGSVRYGFQDFTQMSTSFDKQFHWKICQYSQNCESSFGVHPDSYWISVGEILKRWNIELNWLQSMHIERWYHNRMGQNNFGQQNWAFFFKIAIINICGGILNFLFFTYFHLSVKIFIEFSDVYIS